MTELNKKVVRVSPVRRHEKSKHRAYILSLEPVDVVGVRLQGTRQCYRINAAQLYEMAVRWHETRVERKAKEIARDESIPMRRARPKARKELARELSA